MGLALSVVNFDDHLDQISRNISIFLEWHLGWGCSFWHATTTCHICNRVSVLRSHQSGFSQDDFPTSDDPEIRGHRFDSSQHMIDDDSFLSRSAVIEWSRPPLESFKTEGEGVLSRLEPWTIEDSHLGLCEHVSCLIVSHPVVPIMWCPDVFRSMVVVSIAFRFAIRYINILTQHKGTSWWQSSCGGMAAMGSWGGGPWWLGLRRGLWSSVASTHLTH